MSEGPGRDPLPGWRPYLLAMAAVVVVATGVLGLHVWRYQQLSPNDELQHIDYTYRMLDLDFARRGDLVGQGALRAQACRGIDAVGVPARKCFPHGTYDARSFQEGGQNTAWVNLPGYYLVAAGLGKLVNTITPISDFVNGARLVGILWASAAAVMLIAALRRLRVSAAVSACAAALVVTHPVVLQSNATLNPDGTALVGGALLLLLPLFWGDKPAWGGKVADGIGSAVAISLKITNIVSLGPGGLFRALLRYDRLTDEPDGAGSQGAEAGAEPAPPVEPWWRRFARSLPAAVPILVGAVFTLVLSSWWAALDARIRADQVIMNQRFTVEDFPTEGLVGTVFRLGPLTDANLAPMLRHNAIWLLGTAVALGVLVCVVVECRKRTVVGRMALSMGVGMLAGGPLVTLIAYFGSGIWIGGVPTRYYESLLVGLALVAAAVVDRHRASRLALYGLSGAWLAAVLYYIAVS